MKEINLKRINNWLVTHKDGKVKDMLEDFKKEDYNSWLIEQNHTYWLIKDKNNVIIRLIYITDVIQDSKKVIVSCNRFSVGAETNNNISVIRELPVSDNSSELLLVYQNEVDSLKISKKEYEEIYKETHFNLCIDEILGYLIGKFIKYDKNN